ncbi:unnamed protein product [Haemonchus placei]|uniref:Aa_trans domain-containing protein n=1 Tax=Haemonchus placei TaxID=6290 RepID=A0A0N4WFP1_HAEPC|nr:unnamed protein product [Haemonchus placei]
MIGPGCFSVAMAFKQGGLWILQHFDVGTNLTIKELLLLYTIPTILINFVRSIRAVTIVCTIGNIFIFASIALILEELFTSEHHWKELPWVTSFDGVLPLENKLKHPQDMLGWTGVLTTGMSLVTIIYSYCGFYGYITFGNAVQGSVTLNLPDSTVNVVVKFLLIFVVFFGNVLQLYVIIEMLWPKIKEKLVLRAYQTITISLLEYLFRIGVVCFAMLWAIAIPNLNEIIPFVGITAGMLLSLIIPSVIDVIVFYPVRSKSDSVIKLIWFVMHNLFLFIVGCFFLVSGLQANIVQLINKQ